MARQTNSLRTLLGQHLSLEVQKVDASGAWLSEPQRGLNSLALLPTTELEDNVEPGTVVDVTLFLGSENAVLATRSRPKLALNEVAFLEVKDCSAIGAFFDWGLPKELLVPFAEQNSTLELGETHPVALYLDREGRPTGTMDVRRFLADPVGYVPGQWVSGEAWRKVEGIGVFVILERRYVGLLPAQEPHDLSRGQREGFRIASLLQDGKVRLSLRGPAHEELDADAEHLFLLLSQERPPRLADHCPPEQIRAATGLSKKAFKRGLGRLLKQRRVQLDEHGCAVVIEPK